METFEDFIIVEQLESTSKERAEITVEALPSSLIVGITKRMPTNELYKTARTCKPMLKLVEETRKGYVKEKLETHYIFGGEPETWTFGDLFGLRYEKLVFSHFEDQTQLRRVISRMRKQHNLYADKVYVVSMKRGRLSVPPVQEVFDLKPMELHLETSFLDDVKLDYKLKYTFANTVDPQLFHGTALNLVGKTEQFSTLLESAAFDITVTVAELVHKMTIEEIRDQVDIGGLRLEFNPPFFVISKDAIHRDQQIGDFKLSILFFSFSPVGRIVIFNSCHPYRGLEMTIIACKTEADFLEKLDKVLVKIQIKCFHPYEDVRQLFPTEKWDMLFE